MATPTSMTRENFTMASSMPSSSRVRSACVPVRETIESRFRRLCQSHHGQLRFTVRILQDLPQTGDRHRRGGEYGRTRLWSFERRSQSPFCDRLSPLGAFRILEAGPNGTALAALEPALYEFRQPYVAWRLAAFRTVGISSCATLHHCHCETMALSYSDLTEPKGRPWLPPRPSSP